MPTVHVGSEVLSRTYQLLSLSTAIKLSWTAQLAVLRSVNGAEAVNSLSAPVLHLNSTIHQYYAHQYTNSNVSLSLILSNHPTVIGS